jgi:hypothetical protein
VNLKFAAMSFAVLLARLCSGADELKPIVSIPLRLSKVSEYAIDARINDSDPSHATLILVAGTASMLIVAGRRRSQYGPWVLDCPLALKPRGDGGFPCSGDAGSRWNQILQSNCSSANPALCRVLVQYWADGLPAIHLAKSITKLQPFAFYRPEQFHYGGPGKAVPFILRWRQSFCHCHAHHAEWEVISATVGR